MFVLSWIYKVKISRTLTVKSNSYLGVFDWIKSVYEEIETLIGRTRLHDNIIDVTNIVPYL